MNPDELICIPGIEMSPAMAYSAENDLSHILDDIAKGDLPCGSGEPFPVNWDLTQKGENTEHTSPPWRATENGFYNPWANNLW